MATWLFIGEVPHALLVVLHFICFLLCLHFSQEKFGIFVFEIIFAVPEALKCYTFIMKPIIDKLLTK